MRKPALIAALVAALALAGAWMAWRANAPPARLPDAVRAQVAPERRDPAAADIATAAGNGPALSAGAPVAARGSAPAPPSDAHRVPVDEDWASLRQAADAGDVRAACRLSLLLDACRHAREERAYIDTEIRSLAAAETEDAHRIAGVAEAEQRIVRLDARCGGAPTALAQRSWKYLLDAARAGHGPSMYRFIVDPPIDATRPLEYVDALVAYRDHVLPMVDALIARGSAEGLVAAYLLTSGVPIVGDAPLYPADPEGALRAAAALAELRGNASILENAHGRLGDTLAPDALEAAVTEGRQMAASFAFRFARIGNGVEVDREASSCDLHWQP